MMVFWMQKNFQSQKVSYAKIKEGFFVKKQQKSSQAKEVQSRLI